MEMDDHYFCLQYNVFCREREINCHPGKKNCEDCEDCIVQCDTSLPPPKHLEYALTFVVTDKTEQPTKKETHCLSCHQPLVD
jgi:hypothetical protein